MHFFLIFYYVFLSCASLYLSIFLFCLTWAFFFYHQVCFLFVIISLFATIIKMLHMGSVGPSYQFPPFVYFALVKFGPSWFFPSDPFLDATWLDSMLIFTIDLYSWKIRFPHLLSLGLFDFFAYLVPILESHSFCPLASSSFSCEFLFSSPLPLSLLLGLQIRSSFLFFIMFIDYWIRFQMMHSLCLVWFLCSCFFCILQSQGFFVMRFLTFT